MIVATISLLVQLAKSAKPELGVCSASTGTVDNWDKEVFKPGASLLAC